MLRDRRGCFMDETILKVKSLLLSLASRFTKKQKMAALAAAMVVVLAVSAILLLSGNGVKGRYAFYRISIDGEGISMHDAGYMEIAGVGNGEPSMFYIDLSGSTSRIIGPVYEIKEYDDYTKYRFEVSSQSGSALEDMDYFYFYYYPHRGDNGMIEVKGNGAILYFKRSK